MAALEGGESLHEIGRAFGKDHGSIQFLLAQHGGIAPAVRRRSQRTLTLAEREDISRGIASGSSIREIAGGLGRAASTVSREVARHGGRPAYRASEADQQAWKPLSCRPDYTHGSDTAVRVSELAPSDALQETQFRIQARN